MDNKTAELQPERVETSSIYADGYSASSSYTGKRRARQPKQRTASSDTTCGTPTFSDSNTSDNVYSMVASLSTPLDIGFSLKGARIQQKDEKLILTLTNNITVIITNFFSLSRLPDIVFGGTIIYTGEEFLSTFAPVIYKEYLSTVQKNKHNAIAMQLKKGIFQHHATKPFLPLALDDKVRSPFWNSLTIDQDFLNAWDDETLLSIKKSSIQPIVVHLPAQMVQSNTPNASNNLQQDTQVATSVSAPYLQKKDFEVLHAVQDVTPYRTKGNIITESILPGEYTKALITDIHFCESQRIINTTWDMMYGTIYVDIEGNVTYTPTLLTLHTYTQPYTESFKCTAKTHTGQLVYFTVTLLFSYEHDVWKMQILPATDISTAQSLTNLTLLVNICNPLQGDFLYFSIPLAENTICTQNTSSQICLSSLDSFELAERYLNAVCCSIEKTSDTRYISVCIQGILHGVTYKKNTFFALHPVLHQEEYSISAAERIQELPTQYTPSLVEHQSRASSMLEGSLYTGTTLEYFLAEQQLKVTRITALGKTQPIGTPWNSEYATVCIQEDGTYVYTLTEDTRARSFEKPVVESFLCTVIDASQHIYTITLAIELFTVENALLLRRMENYELLLKEASTPNPDTALTLTVTLLNPAQDDYIYVDTKQESAQNIHQVDTHLLSIQHCVSMQMCTTYVDSIILYIPHDTSLHTRYVLVAIEGFENNVYTTTQHIYTIQPIATCHYYYVTAPYTEYTTTQDDTEYPSEIPSNDGHITHTVDASDTHADITELPEQSILPNEEIDIAEKEEVDTVVTPSASSTVMLPERICYTLSAEEAIQMQEPHYSETRIVGTHTESVALLGDWVQVSQQPVYKNGIYYQHFVATHGDTSTPVYFATPISVDTQHVAVKNS